jgi:hypothetical protein
MRERHGRTPDPPGSTGEHPPSDEQFDSVHHSVVEQASDQLTPAFNQDAVHTAPLEIGKDLVQIQPAMSIPVHPHHVGI